VRENRRGLSRLDNADTDNIGHTRHRKKTKTQQNKAKEKKKKQK
jgi:hypothetical protein